MLQSPIPSRDRAGSSRGFLNVAVGVPVAVPWSGALSPGKGHRRVRGTEVGLARALSHSVNSASQPGRTSLTPSQPKRLCRIVHDLRLAVTKQGYGHDQRPSR